MIVTDTNSKGKALTKAWRYLIMDISMNDDKPAIVFSDSVWLQEYKDYLKSTKSVFDTMTPLEVKRFLYGSWEASEGSYEKTNNRENK